MIRVWLEMLAEDGPVYSGDRVVHFGDPVGERQAARDALAIAPLDDWAYWRVTGDDAVDFLHAQLSNDVAGLESGRWQLDAYCTPKGRALALPELWHEGDSLLLRVSRELGEATLQRLQRFVLRSKVKFEPLEWVSVGLSGPDAGALLERAGLPAPEGARGAAQHEALWVLARPGGRYELAGPGDGIGRAWARLRDGGAVPVGADCWAWLDIRAGWPRLHTATVEQFVPQMLNLDLLDGVNFKKGCYPGQEIVARMKYLGRVKQRMLAGWTAVEEPPLPGTKIYAGAEAGQAAGQVVEAQPAPDGGCDLLMVIRMNAAREALHAGASDGPAVAVRALPYEVPELAGGDE